MKGSVTNNLKHRYAIAKHHAWAGSVLLAILGALRWFTSESDYPHLDLYFIVAGIFIILYILIALIFTYRYRSGLSITDLSYEKNTRDNRADLTGDDYQDNTDKEKAKIEKKRAKSDTKRMKKLTKAKEKENKKSSD